MNTQAREVGGVFVIIAVVVGVPGVSGLAFSSDADRVIALDGLVRLPVDLKGSTGTDHEGRSQGGDCSEMHCPIR